MFKKSAPQPDPQPRQERVDRKERTDRNEQSFLQRGVRIEGDISAEGDLRVDGQVRGTLKIAGLLTVGPEATLSGTIRGRSVVIHGGVEGQVQAEDRVHLSNGAKVKADLYCRSLIIDEGVQFDGCSHMGETIPTKSESDTARLSTAHPGTVAANKPQGTTDRVNRGPAAPHPSSKPVPDGPKTPAGMTRTGASPPDSQRLPGNQIPSGKATGPDPGKR